MLLHACIPEEIHVYVMQTVLKDGKRTFTLPQRVWHLGMVPTIDVKNPNVGRWRTLTVGLHLPAEDRHAGVWRCH